MTSRISCPRRRGRSASAIAALVLLPVLGGAPVLAQEDPSDKLYDGTWSAHVRGLNGGHDATVVLAGFDGTWQERGAKNGCAGKKAPLTVQTSTADLLHFTVWGEKIGPRCPDLTIVVRPRGEKVLEGAAELGANLSETAEERASHGEAPAGAAPAASAASARAGSVRLTRR